VASPERVSLPRRLGRQGLRRRKLSWSARPRSARPSELGRYRIAVRKLCPLRLLPDAERRPDGKRADMSLPTAATTSTDDPSLLTSLPRHRHRVSGRQRNRVNSMSSLRRPRKRGFIGRLLVRARISPPNYSTICICHINGLTRPRRLLMLGIVKGAIPASRGEQRGEDFGSSAGLIG